MKPTEGRMLDLERWYVWLAFISMPRSKFPGAAIDVQQDYMRRLCENAHTLEELASMAG